MKLDRPVFSSHLNLPTSGDNWLSILFLVIAIVSGIAIAVIIWQFGWIGLLAAPFLFFLLAILIRPELGLGAFIFIIFIQLTPVIKNYYPRVPSPVFPLLGMLVFLIIWRMVIYGDRPDGWKRASVILVVMAFWLLSVLVADDSVLALAKFRKFTENAILAFVIVFFIQRPTSLRSVVWALLAAGILMTTISVFQNLTSTYDNNYWGFGEWDQSSTAGVTNHRATGPYGNPNAYAQVLVMLVPLALDRFWHEKELRFRLLAGWALIVCILTIFFTYSRNGFITLLFTVGFFFVIRRPKVLSAAVMVVLAFVVFQFLPLSYTERITTLFQFSSSNSPQQILDESFRGRLSENIAAWRMFQDNPLFGVGLDNFQVNYQRYSRQIGLDSRRDERTPASFYLELLSEQGLIGTMVFMLFIVIVFRNLWRAGHLFQFLGMKNEEYMTLAFLSGLAGFMVFYISKNSAYPNVFWVLLGIAFSIAQVAENSVHSSKPRFPTPPRGLNGFN
jgi:putative inorganic carbon (HCO3(-)) transporter